MAGKSLESAALIAKEMNDLREAAALYVRAHNYYTTKGMPDKAAEALNKGAKYIRPIHNFSYRSRLLAGWLRTATVPLH